MFRIAEWCVFPQNRNMMGLVFSDPENIRSILFDVTCNIYVECQDRIICLIWDMLLINMYWLPWVEDTLYWVI